MALYSSNCSIRNSIYCSFDVLTISFFTHIREPRPFILQIKFPAKKKKFIVSARVASHVELRKGGFCLNLQKSFNFHSESISSFENSN